MEKGEYSRRSNVSLSRRELLKTAPVVGGVILAWPAYRLVKFLTEGNHPTSNISIRIVEPTQDSSQFPEQKPQYFGFESLDQAPERVKQTLEWQTEKLFADTLYWMFAQDETRNAARAIFDSLHKKEFSVVATRTGFPKRGFGDEILITDFVEGYFPTPVLAVSLYINPNKFNQSLSQADRAVRILVEFAQLKFLKDEILERIKNGISIQEAINSIGKLTYQITQTYGWEFAIRAGFLPLMNHGKIDQESPFYQYFDAWRKCRNTDNHTACFFDFIVDNQSAPKAPADFQGILV